jgi:drug/metabolite transporter (DMT)-like permease
MKEIIHGRTEAQRICISIAFVLGISLLEAGAQYNIRKSNDTGDLRVLFLGILLYTSVCLMLYYAYDFDNIGHINLLWSCISIILAYMSGYFFFNENFNIYTILAVISCIIAIIFSYLADA